MRIAILSFVILLCVQTAFAVSRLPQSTSGSEETKPPKALYSKGKGTIGLVSALVLGPVGWLGVRALSRNKTQRKKAGQGLKIWGAVVIATAMICLLVLWAKSGGGGSPNFNFGSSGGSAPQQPKEDEKEPKIEAIPQPPIHVPEPPLYVPQASSPIAIKPL
jgi:hypothetical protein